MLDHSEFDGIDWENNFTGVTLRLYTLLNLAVAWLVFKGALDKFNIICIPKLFPKKVGIFIPFKVLAWVMIACWVLPSRLTYFWRNLNTFSIFYFSKSTLINAHYSSLWDTLKMMLFTKKPHKMKTHWQNQLKISVLVWFIILYKIRYKCPFNYAFT